jgi:hypothetical protein
MNVTSTSTLESNRRWRQANVERRREYWRIWRAANREKKRAHDAVQTAVKTGRLVRPDRCQICRQKCIPDGHHHNGYANRLDVVWVCKACHSNVNKQDHPGYRPGGN